MREVDSLHTDTKKLAPADGCQLLYDNKMGARRALSLVTLEESASEVLANDRQAHKLLSGERGATAQVIGALQLSFADVEVQHLLEEGIQLGFGQRLVALTYATAEGLGRAP